MKGYRESDSFIVSEKPLNKIGDNKEVEKRRLAERNPSKRNRSQAQNWVILTNEVDRIRYTVMYMRHYLKGILPNSMFYIFLLLDPIQ